jgi:hypothetical protein
MMRKQATAVVVTWLTFATGARAEEPRAVIERAVRAMGVDVDPAKRPATRTTVTFKADGPFTGRGEFLYQPGGPRKADFVAEEGEQRHTLVVVLCGANVRLEADGRREEIRGEELQLIRAAELLFNPTGALPLLLDDKTVTLGPVREEKLDDRAVQVIEVTLPAAQPTLTFDKATGLLVKVSGKFLFEQTMETVLSDWGEPGQRADELLLRDAGIGLEPAALLAFLRKQVPDPAKTVRAAKLVRTLGDESFEVREKASEDLVALGSLAVPHLERALGDTDPEIVRRARDCLAVIAKRENSAVVSAAIRKVVWAKLEGGTEALLALLPGANQAVVRDTTAALVALTERDGKPAAALLRALDNKDEVIRAAAAAVLGKDGGEYLKQPGRPLYVQGTKLPARLTINAGKAISEFELTGVQYFNRLDAKLFADR